MLVVKTNIDTMEHELLVLGGWHPAPQECERRTKSLCGALRIAQGAHVHHMLTASGKDTDAKNFLLDKAQPIPEINAALARYSDDGDDGKQLDNLLSTEVAASFVAFGMQFLNFLIVSLLRL